jgi:uncharacterized protein
MFNLPLFDNFASLIVAGIAGFLFGFLLRKAHVTRFDVIVKQLLLKDFTVMKVIFTAIIFGSIGMYTMNSMGLIQLKISAATNIATMIGGSIFGVGMSILGYCPGTGIAALADGSKDMIYGIMGMIFGSLLFGHLQPYIAKKITLTDPAKSLTFASSTHISAWFFITVLALFAIVFFYLLDKNKLFKKKDISKENG